jgi:hypothetical protein
MAHRYASNIPSKSAILDRLEKCLDRISSVKKSFEELTELEAILYFSACLDYNLNGIDFCINNKSFAIDLSNRNYLEYRNEARRNP